MNSRHQVATEVAYDLMQDHLDVMLSLLERPLPRSAVIRRLGSEQVLDKMADQGLIEIHDDQVSTVAEAYQQVRQEGMRTFLQRYILPSLHAGLSPTEEAEPSGLTKVRTHKLILEPAVVRQLRPKHIAQSLNDMVEISSQPASGPLSRLTVLVVGTSRSVDPSLSEADSVMRQLQYASTQRANPDERDFGILTQLDALADTARYEQTEQILESFTQSLDAISTSSPNSIPYYLTVASHWRCISPMQSSPKNAQELLC